MALNVCILSLNTGLGMAITALTLMRIMAKKRRMEIIPATIIVLKRITPVTVIN